MLEANSVESSQKENENRDQSAGSNSIVKPVDINVQVPQSLCSLGDLSGLINIHFHFK